jgi:tetratricopeptide (TPR) repeat protein
MTQRSEQAPEPVRVERTRVTIPTYEAGEPDRNPMFLEKRVYQGSSGAVYPFPVTDTIASEKRDAEWDAVFLENEYLRIMILPALGGRVQMALDKTNNYHFVYHNEVIKPALVGLAGPWISGGIEFNWPQHHRPNTYGPVDCEIERHGDGSATVWCHEIDRMHGTRGTHGLRLRPGRAVLEIDVRLHNRTRLPQTFLWWANPACAVDENHQSMFPPDVRAVMDHGKRDVSDFPVATGEYYKVDYSPGTDISRYRNIPVPTSYMAYHSDFNYVGSYDWGCEAGLLHVANRHVSPGKKQWTWGHGAFGRAWDRHLTDENGPYIELMCGVFTDNQPDFTWLLPGEQKVFTQHFMPYKGVGRLGNATTEGCIGLELQAGVATVRAYVTQPRPASALILRRAGETAEPIASRTIDASPERHEELVAPVGEIAETDLEAVLLDADGTQLVAYRPVVESSEPIPEPAKAIGPPESLDSTESLYLAARHLEQYRHATRDPEPYLREALRRDPGDSRCNIALAQLLLRRGLPAEAEPCFRAAVDRLTRHNPNPVTGEAHLGLGLALVEQGRDEEAEPVLWKAAWSEAQQSAAFFELARLTLRKPLCARAERTEALALLDRCLRRNADHHQAVHLRVATLFDLGRDDEAIAEARAELGRDPFAFGVLWELCDRGLEPLGTFTRRTRDDALTLLAVALDCVHAGMDARARAILGHALERIDASPAAPDGAAMLRYHLASVLSRSGDDAGAQTQRRLAAGMPRTRCFPNRNEDIPVLREAIDRDASDALAPFALGNLLYSRKRYDEAIAAWTQSARRDPAFATAHRNLGLALFNIRGLGDEALAAYERAFELDPTDARVLYELDQLAKRLGHDPADRLARLDANPELVRQRDDLSIERVALLNRLARHACALDALLSRSFRPWEGGEGKVPAQYTFALTALAEQALDAGQPEEAVRLLVRARHWPASLGEGKLATVPENQIDCLLGLATRELGYPAAASIHFANASRGEGDPARAMYYNDQPPELVYFQGLALRAAGDSRAAERRFRRLLDFGAAHLDDTPEIDYFAVSLPDFLVFEPDLEAGNRAHCLLMMGLGQLGLGNAAVAADHFAAVLAIDPSHTWAAYLLKRAKRDRGTAHEVKPRGEVPAPSTLR